MGSRKTRLPSQALIQRAGLLACGQTDCLTGADRSSEQAGARTLTVVRRGRQWCPL